MLCLQLGRLVNVIHIVHVHSPWSAVEGLLHRFHLLVCNSVRTRDLPTKTQVKSNRDLALRLHADDDLAIHPARMGMSDCIPLFGTRTRYCTTEESNEDIQVPL
jgi:hypothetical protein